jgi:hypothetical protein
MLGRYGRGHGAAKESSVLDEGRAMRGKQTHAEFAARRGLKMKTFQKWLYGVYNKDDSHGGSAEVRLLPVEVVGPDPMDRRIAIELGGGLGLSYAPEAQTILDLIRDIYVVEADAKANEVVRMPAHRDLRNSRSRPIMDSLHGRLVEQQSQYPPKRPLGQALSYALNNNWTELTRFLDDEHIPPDNNRSERALRVVALGRKNYLFVGDETAARTSPASTRWSRLAKQTASTRSHT